MLGISWRVAASSVESRLTGLATATEDLGSHALERGKGIGQLDV